MNIGVYADELDKCVKTFINSGAYDMVLSSIKTHDSWIQLKDLNDAFYETMSKFPKTMPNRSITLQQMPLFYVMRFMIHGYFLQGDIKHDDLRRKARKIYNCFIYKPNFSSILSIYDLDINSIINKDLLDLYSEYKPHNTHLADIIALLKEYDMSEQPKTEKIRFEIDTDVIRQILIYHNFDNNELNFIDFLSDNIIARSMFSRLWAKKCVSNEVSEKREKAKEKRKKRKTHYMTPKTSLKPLPGVCAYMKFTRLPCAEEASF